MPNNFQLLVIVGATFVGSAFILFILSNALSEWSKISTENEEINIGLWSYCTTNDDGSTCEYLLCPSENFKSDFCSKILAARAFITVCCLFSGISALLSIVYCATSGDKKPRRLVFIMKGLAFASLFLGIIGVPVGISATITTENNAQARLGDAAIIGIVAIGINLIGAIITALVKPYL